MKGSSIYIKNITLILYYTRERGQQRNISISSSKIKETMPRIFTFSFMGDATPPPPRPRTAYVQPTKRSSAATKSTKLKDISNAKVPTTDAAAKKPVAGAARRARSFNKFTVKLNEGNTNLLKQVSSQWIMGKGRSQTSKCLFAIRICLDNGIPPDDIANYVANGLETDVQAMEFKRARECAKRISKSTEKQKQVTRD
mmetsp:Transcript_7495/g.12742  ORF Transcript_7495/g.12742 Transcript_7495/m.12742 type:complete len:198 (-) Transcript_7495:109-702(-)